MKDYISPYFFACSLAHTACPQVSTGIWNVLPKMGTPGTRLGILYFLALIFDCIILNAIHDTMAKTPTSGRNDMTAMLEDRTNERGSVQGQESISKGRGKCHRKKLYKLPWRWIAPSCLTIPATSLTSSRSQPCRLLPAMPPRRRDCGEVIGEIELGGWEETRGVQRLKAAHLGLGLVETGRQSLACGSADAVLFWLKDSGACGFKHASLTDRSITSPSPRGCVQSALDFFRVVPKEMSIDFKGPRYQAVDVFERKVPCF